MGLPKQVSPCRMQQEPPMYKLHACVHGADCQMLGELKAGLGPNACGVSRQISCKGAVTGAMGHATNLSSLM